MTSRAILLVEDNPDDEALTLRALKDNNILNQLNDIFGRMAWPFLRPFRRLLPPHKTAGIDWSPLLLLLAIFVIRGVVAYLYGLILFR